MITVERLRELFHYDQESGVFTRKAERARNARMGDLAGCKRPDGYIVIRIDGSLYHAHRLAWLHVTGEWPKEEIDHLNCDPSDNRFANLREATRAENLRNIRKPCDNTSGFKGVSFDKRTGRWISSIRASGKQKYLGRFDTAEAAYAAYCTAAKELHGEFARTS